MGANGPRHQAVGGAIELISAQFSALYSYSSRATPGDCRIVYGMQEVRVRIPVAPLPS